MKRRTFLLAGLGASGALVLGWALLPPRQRLIGRAKPGPVDGTIRLNGWVLIAPDDTVTVVVPKAEMGQGIHTALAMLLAEELGCAWEQVRVTPSPVDQIYANVSVLREGMPLRDDETHAVARTTRWIAAKTAREVGLMMTGGSSSLRDCWEPIREAGASARASLVAAAAARFGVEPGACTVTNGVITHGDRRLRFGEVAKEAVQHRPSRVT
ncbi:MAG: molybdopterin cofactor-binding domain-containing protein, partial [Gemmatimonadaceae bacterium]